MADITNNHLELEADKKEAFLKEYRELVKKYGYDWYQAPLQIVKLEFRNDSQRSN